MTEAFDPYYQWLGIPPKDQPPNRYRLLGLELFEANPTVIENAADQRMGHVRTFQIGSRAEWSQQILNELAAAKVCLLNPEKKAAYDDSLRQELASRGLAGLPRPVPVFPPQAPPVDLPPAVSWPPAAPAPSRALLRRNSSYQAALWMIIAVSLCAVVLLVLLLSQDLQRGRVQVAKPRHPVVNEPSVEPATPLAKTSPSAEHHKPEVKQGERLSDRQALSSVASLNRPENSPSELEMQDIPDRPSEEKSEIKAPSPEVPQEPAPPSFPSKPLADSSSPDKPNREKEALAMGLKWLAAHQHEDGSWAFQTEPNPGRCNHAMAATAMALLPLLRDGHTHQNGEYKENVRRGLEFLGTRAQVGPNVADLRGSNHEQGMYAHGLATIAICEAYLQTKDRKLRNIAQLAVNFIVEAQDPKGGGWRYRPRQRGDTSVLGWQMTALIIAREAKLKVPQTTFARAAGFLDSVQSENGRAYGYEQAGHGTPATRAIGLLMRTCLGWDQDKPALRDGVQSIVAQGPSEDIYFNFYATRLLTRWGHASPTTAGAMPEWKAWKEQMRTRILESQEQAGEARGSWFMGSGSVNENAGRLGVTALTLIILASVASD